MTARELAEQMQACERSVVRLIDLMSCAAATRPKAIRRSLRVERVLQQGGVAIGEARRERRGWTAGSRGSSHENK